MRAPPRPMARRFRATPALGCLLLLGAAPCTGLGPGPAVAQQRATPETAAPELGFSLSRPDAAPGRGGGGAMMAAPRPLAPSTAARLRRIFELQARGETDAAAREAALLDDRRLIGHVLADRWLRAPEAPGVEELRAWLAAHGDQPDAPAIHALLARRLPRGSRAALPPESQPSPAGGEALDPDTEVVPEERPPAGRAVARNPALDRTVRELARDGQVRRALGHNRENASSGLYVYPNLMAADIHAYHATRVPVGEDQKQHLELANDIAQKFNHDYGVEFFPPIEPHILGVAARVMSLRDGTKKMSKSDPSDQSRINLNDDADAIALKIRRARTDPHPLPDHLAGLEGRPEARNLVGILAAVTGTLPENVLREHGGKGFSEFKEVLAEALIAHLAPIAAEMRRLLEDPGALDAALHLGAERARAIADPIVARAEEIVGFLPAR